MSANIRQCPESNSGQRSRRDLTDKEVYLQLVRRAELELRQTYPTARNVLMRKLAKELAKTWQLAIKGKDTAGESLGTLEVEVLARNL